MPLTLSYDLRTNNANHRNYIRSMLERFAWRRLGGSVFRYSGRTIHGIVEEDWLNDVIPSLMFFRSYTIQHNIQIRFFTLDANSVARLDHSDPNAHFGRAPFTGAQLRFRTPTNNQSSRQTIRDFVDTAIAAT
jgi:hypothetical protein